MSAQLALFFGTSSSCLYILWAYFQSQVKGEEHMAGALLLYAGANVFLMWPLIKRFL